MCVSRLKSWCNPALDFENCVWEIVEVIFALQFLRENKHLHFDILKFNLEAIKNHWFRIK